MKKLCVALTLASAFFVSCSGLDVDENAQRQAEKEYAEQTLGFHIDDNHTWNMEAAVNLTVTQYPENFTPVELAIYDVNPLADSTATIVAQTEDLSSPLSFESPSYLHTLYAGCTDANGNMRVVPFSATDSYVDFTAPLYQTQIKARTRADFGQTSQKNLNWELSYNARDLSEEGWADSIAVISGASETCTFTTPSRADLLQIYNDVYPSNDVDRFLHFDQEVRSFYYATVGEGGGEITVTPIGSNGTNNSKLFFGYYYFDKGQAHTVKTVKKYLFNEVYNGATKWTDACQSYKLVYYDANGNPSYTFPEGTEISFFCRAENVNGFKYPLEWYAEGENNIDRSMFMIANGQGVQAGGSHDWWIEANHVIFFERNGLKFVGFEDWISNFNLKDIVMLFDGNVKTFPSLSKPNKLPNHHIYTFAFEDTKNGDFDLNDVVIQVYRGSGYWGTSSQNGIHARLVALGAKDPIRAYFKDKITGEITPLFEGKELHDAFGLEDMSFVNTESINFDFSKANKNNNNNNSLHTFISRTGGGNNFIHEAITMQDIYIVNERTRQEVHTPRAVNLKGAAPYGICIPHPWAWPKERIAITKAYPYFARYATSIEGGVIDVTDWYVTANDDNTLFYNFGFTVN